MQQMAAYTGTSITTELIQKYLDENKQLILAILDNQNLGKLNECAMYQAKLQQNLMYLAAIADAQPQVSQNSTQVSSGQSMQPSQQYIQQQQQQQMMMMNQRNSIPQYMQQSQQGSPNAPSPQQQSYHSQQPQGMVPQRNSDMHLVKNSTGGNGNQTGGSVSEYGKPEESREGTPTSLSTRNDGPQAGASPLGQAREGNGAAGEDSEASYLKSSD
ncbi:uncharacterized protein [Physcomitrium patens]|uniref:SS18 N-terminal domain-containing protein n=1 Tax=Physcomitrium patens TaxID=3218 RepID=A0A7I4F334_PHYPA|nr:GRF1-interacting factor 1-like isoform X1 [Physcomitrium patens]XP_024392594.1 GRF1-interacting factor 1-like isoform X1 [Physcomitrium patens]|eukprot:XP_024392593.1 GRF1-interacting factor 1-like isoform X1 [Physcomitrella patens]